MSSIAASQVKFDLTPPFDRGGLAAFRHAVAEAARSAPDSRIIVDIDGVPVLDSPVIAGLIATLREVREAGGSMALATGRKAILDTLRITALDLVFEVVAPDDEPALAKTGQPSTPHRGRSRIRPRLAVTVLAALFATGGAGAPGVAQDEPTASAVVARVIDANPSLRSYQARVHVDVQMQSFPFLAPQLEGTTYFKRPNNFEVVFDRVPSYARGFERLYADIGDPSSWERRFNLSVVGDRTVNGHRDVVVRLVQKVRGMIDHQDVAIDASTWHVDEMAWHYYTGGVISMTQAFQDVGGSSVLLSQHATIRIPHVRAVADARYTDYRTNVAIDDAVFAKSGR